MSGRRRSLLPRVSRKSGAPPGTLVHVGERRREEARLTLTSYDSESLDVVEVEKVEDLPAAMQPGRVHWINVDGLHDTSVIESLGKLFEIHPLVLEDVLNTGQRAKQESFDGLLFVVMRMIRWIEEGGGHHLSEQVSLLLQGDVVITFQEHEGDVFDAVRERMKRPESRFRRLGSPYLAYALVDAIVDGYFRVLEETGNKVDQMEEGLLQEDGRPDLELLHNLRRDLLVLKRAIWPLRDVLSQMSREESPHFPKDVRYFLRDVFDHAMVLSEAVETYRELASSLHDLQLSIMSNRMNAVMQTLAAIATIFIPLSFLAGVYGMNFQYMPELSWKWSYPVVLVIMGLIMVGMLGYFRSKKWI